MPFKLKIDNYNQVYNTDMKSKLLTILLTLMACVAVQAQEWMDVHRTFKGVDWTYPIRTSEAGEMTITDDERTLALPIQGEGRNMTIPFSIQYLDSIAFANDLDDESKGHNKYHVFAMHLWVDSDADAFTPLFGTISRDDWTPCHVSIDGKGEYSNYSGTARIKGRGNSTWEWYDKKPFKIKLDEKSKLLGLEKAKDWNLLANWRDVTDMMNVFAFETARYMGMPFTNHTRFVEVFLNEEYVGTYQLTEKIEIGKNRVNIGDGGLLMSFDLDDGPSLSPDASDNFWSKVYSLPMCIKEPENLSAAQIDSIRSEFAVLEKAVKSHDYALVESLMDVESFIGILQLHEYLCNVEIAAPRSLYMFRAKDGKWTFGPVWDWDAGYDFSWADMYTGHTFFTSYRTLILGSDPYKATASREGINMFWREMFANSTFVSKYKEAWKAKSDSMFVKPWAETSRYIDEMRKGTYERDVDQWPLEDTARPGGGKFFTPDEELAKMESWIKKRKSYLDGVIANYPAGTDEVEDAEDVEVVVGTTGIHVKVNCTFSGGYTQSSRIEIDESSIKQLLGGKPTSLVPLNANGKEGRNTAAKKYGAWFGPDGNTTEWGADAHVYIESDDLYSWSYGCHPEKCAASHRHTVTMQYRRASKTLNVDVTFTIKR